MEKLVIAKLNLTTKRLVSDLKLDYSIKGSELLKRIT